MSNNEGPSIQTCGKIYSVSVHRQIIPAHLLNLPPRSNVVYVLSWKYIWTSFTPLEFTCMKSWNNENKELFFLLEPSCIYWFNALGYITFSWWIIGNTDLVCQYCLINHRFVFEVIVSHKPKYQNLSKGCYFRKTINHTLSLYGGKFLNENGPAWLAPLWQDQQSSWAELGFLSP